VAPVLSADKAGAFQNRRRNILSNSENTKGRVLVADDDPAILRLVTAILEKEGFAVVGARDGREAYKALQDDSNFTAAVFDVVMPHISGPELVRFMRTEKRFNKIPVMMMTAEQDPKLSSDSFAAGAVVFLPKPFTTSQLQMMLRMLVGKAVSQG
jgi:DNA-binding response OmpR family regulator